MAEILRMLVSGLKGEGFLVMVIALFIGFTAACIIALYERRVMGAFVRDLIARGAFSKETALTLSDAGYEKKGAVKRALKKKGIFAGTVYEASEEPDFDREDHALPIYREGFDEKTARFYIPEALKYRAEVRFEKKGTHVMSVVIAVLLFGLLLAAILLTRARIADFLIKYINAMSA